MFQHLTDILLLFSATTVTNLVTYILTIRFVKKKAENALDRDNADTLKAELLSKRTLVDTIDFLEIRIAEMSAKVDEARTALFSTKSKCDESINSLIDENAILKSELSTLRRQLEEYRDIKK